MTEKCLDTYALWEIIHGNPKFAFLLNDDFALTDWTLIELYKTLLKSFDKNFSQNWIEKFRPYARNVDFETIILAVDFLHENRKQDISLFDSVGYIYSKSNKMKFVTGDKEFKGMDNVLFITK